MPICQRALGQKYVQVGGLWQWVRTLSLEELGVSMRRCVQMSTAEAICLCGGHAWTARMELFTDLIGLRSSVGRVGHRPVELEHGWSVEWIVNARISA